MNVSAVRGVCFALIGLIAAVGVTGQQSIHSGELLWDEVSAAPGTYADSVVIYPEGSRELEYRFLDSAGEPRTSYYLPLTDGVELHAPDSAEIRYSIEIRRVGESATTRKGEFVLDTLAPAAPQFLPSPGLHPSPIELVAAADSLADQIAVRIFGEEESRFTPIPSQGLHLSGQPGAVRDYRIAAYAVDSSGNRSSVTTYQYRIDRSHEAIPPREPLFSPRPGTYANEQVLIFDDTGLTDISVLLAQPGSPPRAIDHRGTPLITGEGDFQLTVEATVQSTGEHHRRSVSWTQYRAPSLPRQGRTTSTVRLRPPPNRPRYTFEDRPVTENDPPWLRTAELTPPPEGTRTVVVRYRAHGEIHDRRLVYLLDGRRAPAPELARSEDPGVVTLYSLSDTEVQWTQIDETSDNNGLRFSESVRGSARIELTTVSTETILVRARFPNGRWTQRTLPVSQLRPPSENASVNISDDGVTVAVEAPGDDQTAIMVDDRSGAELLRFRGTAPLRWRPPVGFTAEIRLGRNEMAPATTIDRTPLAPPIISVDGERLSFSGGGQIFYRLDGSSDTVYETPLELSGVPDARRRYRVDAYRIFESQISPTVTAYPVIDRRVPRVPTPQVASGTELRPGVFISREEVTRVLFPSPYDDLELHYEATSQGEALLPQATSPQVGEGIRLTTPVEREVRWSIRVRGRFRDRDRWSPLSQMEILVDRLPPPAPVLSSDPESSGVIAFEPPQQDDTSIWYRLQPGDPYRRYEGPITIDRDRIENSLTISAYARDRAGNQAVMANSPVVTPLSRGPEPPQLAVNGRLPEDSHVIRAREAVVEVTAPEGVRWRIRETDSPSQNSQFIPYSEPQILSSGTYRINAYRERGSERSRVIELLVTIDPARPQQPDPPYVSYNPDGRSGMVYWAGAQAEQIFASVITDPEADPGSQVFFVSNGILPWEIPEGASSVSLAYFSVGKSGQRSETAVIHLEAARSQPPAVISGVRDGRRYQTGREVEFTGHGQIRFTVTSDGTSPGPVRFSSTLYEEPLVFSSSVGESTHYRLRYRTFDGESSVSEERDISFVIDREPPALPVLEGAASSEYYSESRRVRLLPEDSEDTIMYRIRSDAAEAGDFSPYSNKKILLQGDREAPRIYQIEAYAVDPAGNRSTGIAAWDVTIDTTSLHVSASTGDDQSGDGSRQRPLASLDAALERISHSSRNTIFLAAGDYSVSSQAFLAAAAGPRPLNLFGGYTPEIWTAGPSTTSITVRDRELLILHSALRLEGVSLSQPLRFSPTHRNQHLELRRVEIQTRTLPGLVLTGGTSALFDSTVTREVEVKEGAYLEIQASSLGAMFMERGSAAIHDTIMAGARIIAGSNLTVTNSRINPRRSVDISGLVYAEDSLLEIRSSVVQADSDDPILIRGRNADITVDGSIIYGAGRRSAIAIRARGGRVVISNTLIDIASMGYGYGVFLRDAPGAIDGSAVVMRVAADGIAVAAGDSTVSIDDSLLWISAAEPATEVTATGITVDGNGVDDLVIRNSHLLGYGLNEDLASAIRLGSDGAARIRENRFAGWATTLIQGTTAAAWELSGRLRSVDDLNESRFGRGNRPMETRSVPPRRESPQIPQTQIPEALNQMLRAGGVSESRRMAE